MSIKEDLEIDIKRFLEQIETQNNEDRVVTLRNLMDKYVHLSHVSFVMDGNDLDRIVSDARNIFVDKTLPCIIASSISGRGTRISQDRQGSLSIVESTIRFLSKNDCLKKKPIFNYKEKE